MPTPTFIPLDIRQIQDELVLNYQQLTGRTLQPADIEILLFNAIAYQLGVQATRIQQLGENLLVDYSRAPYLDALGRLVGVERLAASNATTTIQFEIVLPHSGVTIPAGTRVSTADGIGVFGTTATVNVPSNQQFISVSAEALTAGDFRNGYPVGSVNVIQDPLPFLASAQNLNVPTGGADAENDERLRQRIKLAPSAFSVAGSRQAYRFWALTANPGIVDVAVVGPPAIPPGNVHLYPLMNDGQPTPTLVLNQVLAATSGEQVRPLNDMVSAFSPTQVTYTIAVDLVIFDNAVGADLQTAITADLQAFADEQSKRINRDIIASQIIEICQREGVYSATLPGWSDVITLPTEFAFNTGITVSITGTIPQQ